MNMVKKGTADPLPRRAPGMWAWLGLSWVLLGLGWGIWGSSWGALGGPRGLLLGPPDGAFQRGCRMTTWLLKKPSNTRARA
jgi:hypothetical protein